MYRLTLQANWDEDSFPRQVHQGSQIDHHSNIVQYPLWRPPAQWSKTLGFSHTGDFNLFSLGEVNLEHHDNYADLKDIYDDHDKESNS